MGNWKRADKPNPRTGSMAQPKTTPHIAETHPGIRSFTGSTPTQRTSKGARYPGKGAKNQDLRAKM